jgi:hypothetical protein
VVGQGLDGLRAIAQTLHWMTETRQLLAMALPQFLLDGGLVPTLRLLVDHAEADLLRPLFAAPNVQVQSYRRVRWAGRMGLLLEAA